MQRGVANRDFTLRFPPFTTVVKWIVAINLAVYLILLLLESSGRGLSDEIAAALALKPALVVHGQLWRLVTYAFVHQGFLHFFFNMLALWMFGSQLEQTWGARRFLKLYGWGLLGAALFTALLSYAGAFGLNPMRGTIGASGGVYAVLIAFGMTFPESEIMMIFPPVSMKAKYFVWLLIVLTLISSLQGGGDVAYMAHMGGLIAGFVYVKFVHQRTRQAAGVGRYVGRGLSDRAWNAPPPSKPSFVARVRDAYYRWKRRRAAKKFEVYMRKHDRRVFFDEHGNYIPSDDEPPPKKDNGESKGPWVN